MERDDPALAQTAGASVPAADPVARTVMAPAAPPGRVAARIGRYVLLRPVGEGGMGVVYAAYDEELDRRVALKLLHGEASDGSDGSDGRARLVREAQALARLSHPNVVQIHEIGEHDGRVFVAMEYVDGVTLGEWQRAAPRSLADVQGAYRQAAEGLLAAHRAGLVHRDFKPDNVLVGADGRVRVVDFGLARRGRAAPEPAAAAAGEATEPPGATARGALIGTPAYMSPEQFEGRPADARSDVFSFSVALWEALHGERPFAGRAVHEIAAAVVRGERRPPVVDLPARLASALDRGLAVDPDARWSSMEPLCAALAVDPAGDPSAAARQRGLFTAAIGVMAVGIAGGLGVTLWSRGEDDFRDSFAAVGLVGLGVVAALLIAFRGTLLRNRYHRRVTLIILGLAAITASQRALGAAHGAPLLIIILDTAHILAGMSFVAALCFVPWMGVITAISAAAIALGYLRPDLFPGALLLFAPATLITLGVLWRRDARRLT